MKTLKFIITLFWLLSIWKISYSQSSSLLKEEIQKDFLEFRAILENNHCCLYEYTTKLVMDSLFDAHYKRINENLTLEDFFILMAPITARIGCMHTATWMPGSFFNKIPNGMFPLKIKLIEQYAVVTGNYSGYSEIPTGSIILEINGNPITNVLSKLRQITSADAFNSYFINAQVTNRFSMFYSSIFGLSEEYGIKYLPPNNEAVRVKIIPPANIDAVRKVVFHQFNSPPLKFEIDTTLNAAILTVNTFIYYTKVEYFKNFMDSCFQLIKEKKINNLILDLRGNDGGDPFCASILLSYLEKSPVKYFAESYGKYDDLAKPIPVAKNRFLGTLYVLIDGSCGSTNGHFCSLLKYHQIGKFIGTPGGSSYKCNAGKDTEFILPNSKIIITIGRTTYAAAVQGIDKQQPIIPDIHINESFRNFLNNKDVFIECAMDQIRSEMNKRQYKN